jgi:RNA polymerase sigma factor (sigma-70 family)
MADDDSLDTVRIHQCVQRWQAGDTTAADELLRAVGERLEHLTRKMLRGFPVVRGWADTADVLQGTLIRLLDTLRRLQPESTRHFYNLAAMHVRRELVDLARRFQGAAFIGHALAAPVDNDEADAVTQAADPASVDGDLDLWCRFHEAIDQLPPEEREVMGLVFYHGWTQVQIAELFDVDERTVRRRWQSACLKVHRLVGQQLPSP